MPKQTFINLPNDKKETLIHAAMKEFSRAPLFEASISNIVKEAGIPRGSFYQYFEDKEDLYYFLLNEYSQRLRKRFITILENQNGDLMETFIESFRVMLKSLQSVELRLFFKNAFLNMNYKSENTLTPEVSKEELNTRLKQVISLVDKDQLNIKNEDELVHILKILKAVTFQNLIQVFAKDLSIEQSMQNYTMEVNLMKRGLCKQK
ncbi:TetR family transcriptional regulator [Paenisporosarcina quisquiliarum]|uniref:TetR family transcriptional regulator n=1 Tax=Paenisporosarcina quisquiliarum TaxID=365346 RepID=A0A9X3LJB9_9BACL|nr:TetR family transcriptional regulator [Paenisporosarcina quisquiliarum]MCZ8537934.1 TetR family transcriptional regulator [Paenisporosarcina quisquiliarum]